MPPQQQQPHMPQQSQGSHPGGQMPPNQSATPAGQPGQRPMQPQQGQQVPGQSVMSMGQKSRIAPVAKPQGLDPIEILNERENRYHMILIQLEGS